jgi:hypothetical protein
VCSLAFIWHPFFVSYAGDRVTPTGVSIDDLFSKFVPNYQTGTLPFAQANVLVRDLHWMIGKFYSQIAPESFPYSKSSSDYSIVEGTLSILIFWIKFSL